MNLTVKLTTALFLCGIIFPLFISAQTIQKGWVTEQNSGNKPIQGVHIIAIGAAPAVSDINGWFELKFKDKNTGDKITITEVSKKGYEVVNKKEVDNWHISTHPDELFKIVVCPAGLLTQNTIKYYNISLKAVTEGYENKIADLQAQLAKAKISESEYGKLAKITGEQFKAQQSQLEELTDKFARVNFDDVSVIYKHAFEKFQEGKIDSVLIILNKAN